MSIRCVAWRLSHNVSHALWAGGLALLSLGCSDTSHRLGGPNEQALTDAVMTPCMSGAALEPIDDMEDNDGTIDFTAGRAGVWFAFNDQTGTQQPSPYDERFKMSAIDPPRQGSRLATHTSGSGFHGWGAGIGLELRVQRPYDASTAAGISFWARRGPDSWPELQLAIPDSATSPSGGECDFEGGFCHDDFGDTFTLTEEFQHFTRTWDQMVARGWSNQTVTAINPSAIYGVRFQVEGDANSDRAFDFWVDDLSFVCNPE